MASSHSHRSETAPLGQRRTRQRQTIFAVIRSAPGPLTVPEIHTRAQEEVPSVGIATVYRTIKLLQDERLIEPVVLPSGDTRYELAGLGHHHHFQCRICDEVFDLEECPVHIPADLRLPGGYQVEAHELTLFGVCPGCGPGR